MDDSAINCDEIIESYDQETIPTNIYTCTFINYYSIIDSCNYLLLFDKLLTKKIVFYHLTTQITS